MFALALYVAVMVTAIPLCAVGIVRILERY